MQSPSIQELLHPHTPESNPSHNVKVSQLNPSIDSRRESCWVTKHEGYEPPAYIFDSEVLREGSD